MIANFAIVGKPLVASGQELRTRRRMRGGQREFQEAISPMRRALPAAFSLALGLIVTLAAAADLGQLADFGNPLVVFTRGAGVLLRLQAPVTLPAGESGVSFDCARWDVDPASVRLEALTAEAVQVRERQTPTGEPGRLVWRLQAARSCAAQLRLSCALKGIEATARYAGVLNAAGDRLTLTAQATVRNNSRLNLRDVRLQLAPGRVLTATLEPGATIQQELWRAEGVPAEVSFLADFSRFKDSVRLVLRLQRGGTTAFDGQALPGGPLKVSAIGGDGLQTFLGEGALPYAPPHEAAEVQLGSVPQVTLTRARLKGDQVNTRSDVYRKAVVFDMDEQFEFEIENHRAAPLTLRVQEHPAGEWQILKASCPWVKLDAGTVEFAVPLAAGQETKLNYTVKRLNCEP
jgi:hypothetical protein